jgi:hypothetical protein
MSVSKAFEIVAVMLLPTAAIAAALWAHRVLVRLRQAGLERRARLHPVASRAPIEVSAARLRQMLRRREDLLRSTDSAVRTHLVALDLAIVDTASDLADALGLERPERRPATPLPDGELAALISRLAQAGVVLPHTGLRS